MVLGKICGKVTTKQFTFLVSGEAKNFDYIVVTHQTYGPVLCQIVEIVRDITQVLARCSIIGCKQDGSIRIPREPFLLDLEVLPATDEFIQEIVKLESAQNGAFIGNLEGRNIPIYLDLQRLLTKHLAILAKSGAGKSYCVGVLLEEIMEKRVPLLIIDPHGEYSSLKQKNTNEQQVKKLEEYGLKPKGFLRRVMVYGDPKLNEDVKLLTIADSLQPKELLNILPTKLSAAQEGVLYGALKKMVSFDFDELVMLLEAEESPAKWPIIKMIDYLRGLNVFSKTGIAYNELIQGGRCSILNMRGINPDIQQIIVYKMLTDLFEQRKQGKIPPFFCVIEEAHNFCPERTFGQAVSSDILRTIASEGRKFGLGLCVVSQRPARVDKSVLSQVSTQIILKVTNPNDLKAISNSVESITNESESEIQNLAIGQALVSGVVDVPLFVNIRPRMTQHGGESVNMLENMDADKKFFNELDEFERKDLIPIIEPKITLNDHKLMNPGDYDQVLVPCILFLCQGSTQSQFQLLLERTSGCVVKDVDSFTLGKLPQLDELNQHELSILRSAFSLKRFTIEMLMQEGFGLETQNIVESLVKKEYFLRDGHDYKINDKFILSHLRNYQVHEKIQYKAVEFSRKEDANYTADTLKTKLAKFVAIKDLRDCFLLTFVKK